MLLLDKCVSNVTVIYRNLSYWSFSIRRNIVSSIFGIIAMSVSLCVVFLGLTSQIWKNHKRKTCEGLSFTLMLVTLIAYSVWAVYGLTKPDWFLAASQTPGAILALVIIFQYLIYDFPAWRQHRKAKRQMRLVWVEEQIDAICRERESIRQNLIEIAREPVVNGDDLRKSRMATREKELHSNDDLFIQLMEEKDRLIKKLGGA